MKLPVKPFSCRLGFHKKELSINAHDCYGLVGQASMCGKCFRFFKWGRAYIPKHWHKYRKDVLARRTKECSN